MGKYLKISLGFGIIGLVLLFAVPAARALDVPPPPNDTAILDQAEIIDAETEARVSRSLIDYKARTGNEIAVLTVTSLDGEDDFDYSYRVAETWGIGSNQANNGALLFVALDDRKVRIQVGRGLEPYLTDLQSSLLIRQKITPQFKQGNYSGGVEAGVTGMMDVIGGERLSESKVVTDSKAPGWLDWLVYLIFPIAYIPSFLARSKSWWAGGIIGAVPGAVVAFFSLVTGLAILGVGVVLGLLLDYFLSKNYRERKSSGHSTTWFGSGGGFFGGSGGFSGGGGFGGFSGGSFGGGGSGGSW